MDALSLLLVLVNVVVWVPVVVLLRTPELQDQILQQWKKQLDLQDRRRSHPKDQRRD